MPNAQVESAIRDWLADNLNFIEPGLVLLKKEYYLPDTIGSNGYIDLLCGDVYNNFVIIEIKRSSTSSRQMINEILKYHSLVKHNFKARESEIRVIIISTHWQELIRPFSELCRRTKISFKGFKINLNPNSGRPNSLEIIEPLSTITLARKFAWHQGLYLFEKPAKMNAFHDVLNEKFKIAQIKDYVAFNIDGPLKNKKVLTPYAIGLAFQRQEANSLLSAIAALDPLGETDVMDRNDFDDEESYIKHLEGAFISSLEMYEYRDDSELGYSEKLDSMLNAQGWILKEIKRHGIFEIDPRYSDELLIKELIGHDGNNRNKFVGIGESIQADRIEEIQEQSVNCLKHTHQWHKCISLIFKQLQSTTEKFRLIVDIYNPDSIVSAFFFTMTNANPDYLPSYRIFVDYIDIAKTEIYSGEIYWNQKLPKHKLFISSKPAEIGNEVFRVNTIPDNEIDSINMSLIYTTKRETIVNNITTFHSFVKIKSGNIILDKTEYKSIQDYIVTYKTMIMKMIANYNSAYEIM